MNNRPPTSAPQSDSAQRLPVGALAKKFALVALVLSAATIGLAAGAGRSRSAATPIDQRPLSNDSALSTLALGRDTSVVLLYRPADCFSCYGVLADWLQWKAEGGGDVTLVLTRAPRPAQLTQLGLFGITDYRILRDEAPLGFDLPATLLFAGGALVAIAPVKPGHDMLLAHLQANPAAQGTEAAAKRAAVSTP